MRTARRQHRATPPPPKAANGRGIANALALLYSPDSLSEEQRVAVLRELERATYRKPPQGELSLVIPEPDA